LRESLVLGRQMMNSVLALPRNCPG
jgi:hypothetical protein